MANTIPIQERVIDPFASYHSNAVNKLSHIVTHGKEGLLTVNSLQVERSDTFPNTIVTVKPGYVIKDDVLITIPFPHDVDIEDHEQWESDPLTPTGYHYLVLKYEYKKIKPAPEAEIKILKPVERHLILDSDSPYFLLKVLELASPPAPLVFELHDSDPSLPALQRQYLQYYAGGKVELDTGIHTPDDAGKIVYETKRNKFFFGHASDWQELTAGGVAVDIDTDSTAIVSIGQLCYINNNEKAIPAISTSLETGADLCVLTLSDPITGPGRGIVSGFAEGVPVESGNDISPGNILYLSATEAGKVTNIRPDGFFQVVGRALVPGNEFQSIKIIFSPKIMISLSNSGTIDTWTGPDGEGLYSSEIGLAFMDTTAITVIDSHWFDAASNMEIVPARVELFNNGQAARVYMTNNTTTLNYMIQSPASATVAGGGGGGGSGTSQHNLLLNLPYADSGHTGFAKDPHGNEHHSVAFATVAQLSTIDAILLNGQPGSYYTNATNLATGKVPGLRGAIAGDPDNTFLRYNGTTKLPGALYGGVTAPTDSIRLNYDGYFYATSMTAISFYGNGSGLTNLNATNLASGTVHSNRGTTATGSTNFSFLRFTAWTKTNGCFYGGAASTAPNNTTMLNYDGQFRATNLLATGAITAVAVSSFNGVQISGGAGTGIANYCAGANNLISNTTGHSNVAFGGSALQNNTTGHNNVAIGRSALVFGNSASGNVAIGVDTLRSTDGYSNVAVGYNSLYSNTTGYQNIMVGAFAGRSNTTGWNNTAIGHAALFFQTIAHNNVAIGTVAGYHLTVGYDNVAVGSHSLRGITTGQRNVAIGMYAMGMGVSGNAHNNTTVGYAAGYALSTGGDNTFIGYTAGYSVTTGDNNILIGYLAGSSASPGGLLTVQASRIVMGNNNHVNAHINIPWVWPSDERDKTNFGTVSHGLEFVNNLKPISFQRRVSRNSDETAGPYRYGFKAQDILKLEGENPVIINTENPDQLQYNESHLIPVLVNAIKELTAEVNKLKQQKGEI